MQYLIAKFAVLLLLSAVVGFLLGRWWVRRKYVDVTDIHEALSRTSIAMQNTPWDQVLERFDGLKPMIEQLLHHELDTQLKIDLGAMSSQLNILEGKLAQLPRTRDLNLAAMQAHLEHIEQGLQAMQMPASGEFEVIARRLSHIEQALGASPVSTEHEQLLQSITRRVDELQALIESSTTNANDDVSPVMERISQLEQSLAALPQLQVLDQRLDRLEQMIAGRPATAVPATLQQSGSVTGGMPASDPQQLPAQAGKGPLLLESARFGKKDDLKRISGVGPKLERLLNQQGVYYFWQISCWKDDDIKAVDERLDFKGRIVRDRWVAQAERLKTEPGAAAEPAEQR